MAAGVLTALSLLLEKGADPHFLDDEYGLIPLGILHARHTAEPARFEPMVQLVLELIGPDAFKVDRQRAVDEKRERLRVLTKERGAERKAMEVRWTERARELEDEDDDDDDDDDGVPGDDMLVGG